MTVKPIPEGYHSVTPYLAIRDAAKAIDFYKQAFGAEEIMRMAGPDGKIGHAEIRIGDSVIMLTDESPDMGMPSPDALGGSPVSILIYVDDVDAVFDRAVAAGAETGPAAYATRSVTGGTSTRTSRKSRPTRWPGGSRPRWRPPELIRQSPGARVPTGSSQRQIGPSSGSTSSKGDVPERGRRFGSCHCAVTSSNAGG
jgi:uncharacterized glyoxalase superfamily protein PhnB